MNWSHSLAEGPRKWDPRVSDEDLLHTIRCVAIETSGHHPQQVKVQWSLATVVGLARIQQVLRAAGEALHGDEVFPPSKA